MTAPEDVEPRRRPTSHRPKFGAMSVSLLDELMHNTLDAGYAEAARRRAESGQPARPRLVGQALSGVALLLVGLIVGVAYRQTQQQAPQAAAARDALVRDVQRETANSDQLQRTAEALSGRVGAERDAVLARTQAGDGAAKQLRDLEALTATAPVSGPGITVTIGDARPRTRTDPVTGQQVLLPADENGRILDRDLQSVVNALFASGATAVSIDHERLSVTTPIRAAGDAILVDLFPVSSPYTVEAVGDPDSLLPRFVDTDAARRFETFVSTYNIEFSVHRSDRLRLRAATDTEPRYAQPVPDGATTGGRR